MITLKLKNQFLKTYRAWLFRDYQQFSYKSSKSFPFFDSVKILNPLGKELSELRQSLIPNALEVLSFNINRQNKI